MKFFIYFALFTCLSINASERPNILWIVVEDMSSHFNYNGENLVHSPHVDRLAKEGQVFSNAYVTAPVCSTARSAMITGMYQTAIGAHHHRSSRGKVKIHLAKHIKTIPELFKAAGYYTCNGSEKTGRYGKEDYNFSYKRNDLYDGPDWSGRKKGQPFFAQIQLRGGKIRNVDKWYKQIEPALKNVISKDQVELPPYYPDVAAFKHDWAIYLNSVQYTDLEVGKIMQRLKEDKLLDNTIIFFLTDHGVSQARGKQFCYDEGAKVPFIVWAPEKLKPNLREEVIAHIDMSASSLYFAGIDIPAYMQGRTLFGDQAEPRNYVISARDRCDETVDRIRSVRSGDFKYIRNYYPKRPHLQPCQYKDGKPWMPVFRQLQAEGKLNDLQEKLLFSPTRPEEELYELKSDKWELKNLAGDPKYKNKLREMRSILANWIIESDDQGRFPEAEEQYDSDMAATRKSDIKDKNIALMKQWQSEGK
ncbi:sulfatase [Lentisphaera marina]|uniref:sulfatase family protein n=1 Tax=Lentisphaera marina TaxID=1111041 RepID=UPI0023652EDF|nr:sulfatase [Lentisphaera marina]MDD7985193.1 sulfatase [Lentisphaera marina]